ncbi:MAG: response regulator transcription factor [Burkholderiales bacterium]|nr:response regulator transcription factor [Burkholderiales bacterium]MCJ7838257.1 response regulator transcription factor [Burkholderiales bacterium]
MQKLQRILIVDVNLTLRVGLRKLFADDPGIEVLAETDMGRSEVRLTPHLLLMDRTRPGINGSDAAAVAELKRRYPQARLLLILPQKPDDFIHACLDAGADGCIRKDAALEELRAAIHSVLQGQIYLDQRFFQKEAGRASGGGLPGEQRAGKVLTPRERQVLKLVAAGKTSKDIAELLDLSVKTVGKHRTNLLSKLDLHNAAELTAYAMARGLQL